MRALSVGANLTAATNTLLYTVPTGYYAKVFLIRAVNHTASNKHITFDWVDVSASDTYAVVFEQAITSKTTFEWDGNAYFVLEEGDQLKATSESGSTFSVIATIEEIGLTRQ